MKIIKWISSSLLILLLCGCPDNLPNYSHALLLSFQDASGKDLVEGIAFDKWNPEGSDQNGGLVKPDLYSLAIQFSDPCQDAYDSTDWGCMPCDGIPLVLGLIKSTSYHYLEINFQSKRAKNCSSNGRIITFDLTCPYVFDDDEIHKIVTYWKLDSKQRQILYRIEVDGKESTQIAYQDKDLSSVATIILKTK